MISILSLLALDPHLEQLQPLGSGTGGAAPISFYEVRMILLSVGALTLVLVLWAIFLRKRKKKRHHSQHSRSSSSSTSSSVSSDKPEAESQEEGHHHGHHHKKKLRRRDHRPRNPTLAETGGLPPVRPEEAPPTSK